MFPNIEFIMHLKHEAIGHKVDCPDGNGFYTFFHFINPAKLTIGDCTVNTLPNACCIISPGQGYCIEAISFPLLHDYICFSASSSSFFETKHLNYIFYPHNSSEISLAVEDIQYNYNVYIHDKPEDDSCVEAGINWLFLTIDTCFEKQVPIDSPNYSHSVLKELRTKIYTNVKEWTIERMITESYFSRSHFYRKWKELFGVSPKEDLFCASMREAKKLVLYSNLTIQEIAFELGYNSSDYFVRCFKQYYGLTPGSFRKSMTD